MAPRLPHQPVPEPAFKHVIATYVHKVQQVVCVCGWEGSSASRDNRNSEWSAHLAANRTAGSETRS